MADAVGCSIQIQITPAGNFNMERMIKSVLNIGSIVKACGT